MLFEQFLSPHEADNDPVIAALWRSETFNVRFCQGAYPQVRFHYSKPDSNLGKHLGISDWCSLYGGCFFSLGSMLIKASFFWNAIKRNSDRLKEHHNFYMLDDFFSSLVKTCDALRDENAGKRFIAFMKNNCRSQLFALDIMLTLMIYYLKIKHDHIAKTLPLSRYFLFFLKCCKFIVCQGKYKILRIYWLSPLLSYYDTARQSFCNVDYILLIEEEGREISAAEKCSSGY